MRKIGLGLVVCLTAAVGCVATAQSKDATAFFDKPLKVVHVPLPHDPDNPQAKPEVRCSYFRGFAVKEIDTGEVDADQLSILDGENYPCRKENTANEKVVASYDWSGYFAGALGDYVFFNAGDGWNGGLGFAVFTHSGKKLFDDVAKDWSGIYLTALPAPAGIASNRAIALRYIRVYGAPCSLANAQAGACWQRIQHDTGLKGSAPDCKALYAKEQRRTPKLAKEVLDDPTVIEYDAATTIAANGVHITAVQHAPLTCAPAE
jgi:hypothetical protein